MVASIYFHIPFCTKKCPYCHFFVLKDHPEKQPAFMKALKKEYEQKKSKLQDQQILSIYFGGGTPSKLPSDFYASLIAQMKMDLQLSANCEVTIEVNPEDVTPTLIESYGSAGINRISMGVQSFDDQLLKSLGRMHDAKKALNAINTIAKHIPNLTIDLMYDLPGQSLLSWIQTVNQVETLPIQHLSLYNLGFEPGSAFFRKKKSLLSLLPSEEQSSQMLSYALDAFDRFGLKQYEISAFAREDNYSIHNTGYWQGRPFLGLGPSAFSYWEQKRFQNICNLKTYCEKVEQNLDPIDFSEKLSTDKRIKELLVIGIRMLKGIDLASFTKKVGDLSKVTKTQLTKLQELGFVKQNNKQLQLTKKGARFYDTVAQELI